MNEIDGYSSIEEYMKLLEYLKDNPLMIAATDHGFVRFESLNGKGQVGFRAVYDD